MEGARKLVSSGAPLPKSPPRAVERIGERDYPPGWRWALPAFVRRWLGRPRREVVFRVRLHVDDQAASFRKTFLPSWHESRDGYLPSVVELACRSNPRSGSFRATVAPFLTGARHPQDGKSYFAAQIGNELHAALRAEFGSDQFDADLILPESDADA